MRTYFQVRLFVQCELINAHRIEVAVKRILSGMEVQTNASVANPEALNWFREWAKKNG